jgi:hypothetical protein
MVHAYMAGLRYIDSDCNDPDGDFLHRPDIQSRSMDLRPSRLDS